MSRTGRGEARPGSRWSEPNRLASAAPSATSCEGLHTRVRPRHSETCRTPSTPSPASSGVHVVVVVVVAAVVAAVDVCCWRIVESRD